MIEMADITDLEDVAVEQTLKMLQDKWKEALLENDKYATGATHDSIEIDKQNRIVGCVDESAFFIEFGTEPGTVVPIEELEKWAKAKFGVSGIYMKNIAKKVQEKIERDGIEDTRMVYLMLEEMVARGTIARVSE